MLPDKSTSEREKWIWIGSIAYLAGLMFTVFFIAEHDPKMSTVSNFVQEIEDQESWAAGGNSLRRLAFLSCAGSGVVGLMLGGWGRFRWNLPMILFIVYLLWCGATIIWSIDSGATMRRYILMMCCAVGCLGLARFYSIEQVLISTIVVILGWLLVGVSAEIFFGAFRPHAGDYRFAGTLHPNLQAANQAILCLSLIHI